MADEAKELLLEEDKSIVEHAYTARGDQSLMDMLRHFFTRGHQGRVTCVDASAAADFVVSGGVDYTVRIWKYDITHASYDLFAILVQTPPVPLPVEEKGICQKIWEMAFPKEIDWDDEVHSNRGITAVAPLSSRYENPFDEKEKMRNGPIASGNAHGDFFLHSMYSMVTDEESGEDNCMVKGSYKCIRKLHSGAINDLAVGPLYADGEEGNTFQIATSGEDNCVKLIKVTCEELSNPNYAEPPAAPQGLEAVANFFFKGGGIVRDTGKKLEKRSSQEMVETVEDVEAAEMDDAEVDEEDEVEEVEDKYVLGLSEMSDRDSVITLTHKAPVDCCRFVGDYGKAKARFVSCTKDGVYLWSGEGACMAELSLSVERYRRAVHDKLGDWKVSLDEAGKVQKEILCCSAAWKKNGTLIFASTDCGEEKYVGVWSIKKGDPGLLNEEYSGLEYKEAHKVSEKNDDGLHMVRPVAIYHQPGVMMDVDKQGHATAFVTDRRQDFDIAMWNLEAAPPNMMLFLPEDPANLLIMPGRETVDLVMTHSSKVIDTTVVEDSEGPALVVGCDEGAVYAWDLSGHDKGQIYAEMRSLLPQEVFLPPLLLIVGAMQMVSFAFGPAIPWKETVKQPAVVTHQVMMLDFKFTVKIDKAMIFWPEVIAILIFQILFLFSAFGGLPAVFDSFCRSVQNSSQFKYEMENGAGFRHLVLKVAKGLTAVMYLMMQLLSTVLVVPIVQSIAESLNCVRPEDTPWTDMLTGNPHNTIYLASAPDVMCFKGNHVLLLLAISILLPIYFYTLVPFAVCGGDAHYVPRSVMLDYKIWEKDNTWWKASERAATDLHLAFLHPNPREVFRTNMLDLMAKISLPVVTILCAPDPLVEMCFVFLIGTVMWINSMVHPPYVERKMTVLVQDLKLFTMLTMGCGVLTVYLQDPSSNVPIYCLIGSGVFVLLLLVLQMSLLQAGRPVVHKLVVGNEDVEPQEPQE